MSAPNNDYIAERTGHLLANRVAELRKQNKLTLEQLSQTSGVSRSMLSQIERGTANPTLAVAFRIAKAFSISIGELVDEPWINTHIEVIHGSDPVNVFRDDEVCHIRTLSPLHMEKNIEFYEITIAANQALKSSAHHQGTKELITILKGEANIIAGDTNSILQQGDSAHYRADLEHAIVNNTNAPLLCHLVVTYK